MIHKLDHNVLGRLEVVTEPEVLYYQTEFDPRDVDTITPDGEPHFAPIHSPFNKRRIVGIGLFSALDIGRQHPLVWPDVSSGQQGISPGRHTLHACITFYRCKNLSLMEDCLDKHDLEELLRHALETDTQFEEAIKWN